MKKSILMILYLAIPAMISSISGVLTILFCTRILGEFDTSNYYLLASFLPINYMMISLYEAIRSSSLTISSVCQENYDKIAMNVLRLTLISLLVFSSVLIIFTLIKESIALIIGVRPDNTKDFYDFTSLMIISGAFNCICYIFSSTFFAIKRPILGMSISLIVCLFTCFFTYLFSKYMSLSWMSYVLGSLTSSFLGIIIGIIFLSFHRVFVFSNLFDDFYSIFKKLSPIARISIPVFFAYLSVFMSLFFINATLNYFDNSVVAGFSVAFRIQNMVILPAITIGTSIAILTNQIRLKNNPEEEKFIMLIGFGICIFLYTTLAIVIYSYRSSLMSMVITDKTIISSGALYLNYVSLSYLAMGPNIAYLTYLQLSGEGMKGFLMNIFNFVIVVGAGCGSTLYFHNYTYLYVVISIVNIVFFIYLIFSFLSRFIFINQKKYRNIKDLSYV